MSTPIGDDSIGSLLREVRAQLTQASIASPDLEAELILRQALRPEGAPLPSKAALFLKLPEAVPDRLTERAHVLLARRLARVPSAYITGTREFWGLEFEVSPDVLIPRPETELLVEKALSALRAGGSPQEQTSSRPGPRSSPTIVDVGTGSGAIAIPLIKEFPAATAIATDLSWAALRIAERNASRHGVERRISFRHGDLLFPVDTYVDLIVANLPYVPDRDWRELEPEVRDHEPALALRGGADGLDLVRALLVQAPRYLRPGGSMCLEFGIGQDQALPKAVRASFPAAKTKVYEDFAGIPRVLVVSLQPV